MKQEQLFLNNLLDFSNLISKRTQYQPSVVSSNHEVKNVVNTQKSRQLSNNQRAKSPNNRLSQPIPPTNTNQAANNQKLLKTFNALRQKLNQTQRQNISLKQEQQVLVKQVNQFQDKQKYFIGQIQTLNKKNSSLSEQLTQYKHRLHNIKSNMQKSQQKLDQYQSLKLNCIKLMQDNKRLKQQLQMGLQISVQQKMFLEEQVQTLKLKQIQYTKSYEQIQNQLYDKNKAFIKLENQFKKLKLVYDEEVYSKKINSESTFLARENEELKLKLEEVQSKFKKEKNKKYELESKLLDLEEKVRLYGTKTDIYEGQLQIITKKMKKVQKDQQSTKKEADQALNEKLSWQQKFYNSVIICQELISRVKRQLKGDVFDLAKTCQFRLNKIKNDQKVDLRDKTMIGRQKSSQKRLRSQTMKQKNHQNYHQQNNEQQGLNNTSPSFDRNLLKMSQNNLPTESKPFNSTQNQFTKTTVIRQSDVLKSKNQNTLQDVKRRLFNANNQIQLPSSSKSTQKKPHYPNTNFLLIQQNQQSQALNNMNLQTKIRKQRQLMQRKLRQKMLYHKLEDTTSSPLKHKLREQYFNVTNQC